MQKKMLELPDHMILNVISFLNINEIITLTSLNKQLSRLNPWNFLSNTYNFSDSTDNPKKAFKSAYLKTRMVPENELDIVWGKDPNYWIRNLDTSEFNQKARCRFTKTCALLQFVWWFEIIGCVRSLNSGTHCAFIRIGKYALTKGLGKNNFECSVSCDDQKPEPFTLNTTPCKYSPSGFYWIYLGKTTLQKPGVIRFGMKDTSQDLKSDILISHVEVLPYDQISDEQSHATTYGWSFALSPGGAFAQFM